MTTLEVVGYKGIVGNATYQWLLAMKPQDMSLSGRDKGDTISYQEKDSVISFVCVPEAQVKEVCGEIARYADLIVIRSTVPPGTCNRLQKELGVHVSHNPEFLREATAVNDMFSPHHIVIGACCQAHGSLLKGLYKPAYVQTVITDSMTSEFVKIATNNYLACLVSFWNETENIAHASGVSGHKIGTIASLDPRIDTYGARWHHQFGGKCLPKDLRQMIEYATSIEIKTPILKAIQEVNESLPEL